jgi:cobalt/nickel transport system permease protein
VYAAEFAAARAGLGRNAQALFASWASVFAASVSCSILLAASGTVPFLVVLPAMAITHAVIGIGEGLLTILLLNAISNRMETPSPRAGLALAGLGFCVLAILLPFASRSPDGLERVAINLGFFSKALTVYNAPLGGYSVAFLQAAPYLAGLVAALAGTAAVSATAYFSVSLISPRTA